ncbi:MULTISPECIES: Mrp/NBP35 family ATP-binding protein [unclassified Methanothermobacter]|uniref:Mrp/NBP35 family ATP-binding protein n=1 Tax=unclassified Methanothermobacter TaxID=2631116 RepID=UPI001365B25D|nr:MULTISPECIES: Mrp/NBP35 family ATP-binding protein [unclassified Methanothermobacter]QHN07830.1 Mrp/NBP35 family ATP-binding protein [Methanothermobacter sp. THM-2]
MDSEDAQKLAIMEQDIRISKAMSTIKHKIVVMSGKGGVGKSTITVKLAEEFKRNGQRVCVLDADIHGPDVPRMMGVEELEVTLQGNRINPVTAPGGVSVVSIEFFLPATDTPVIWRGPKKTGAIRQLLADTDWSNVDVLLVDNPPGTGDEPLTVLQSIPRIDGVIIVTTSQELSLHDVEKCINMAGKLNIPIIGIVENMSYLICPECGKKLHIFGKEGGRWLSEKFNIPFLGEMPFVNSSENSISNTENEIKRIFENIKDLIGAD